MRHYIQWRHMGMLCLALLLGACKDTSQHADDWENLNYASVVCANSDNTASGCKPSDADMNGPSGIGGHGHK